VISVKALKKSSVTDSRLKITYSSLVYTSLCVFVHVFFLHARLSTGAVAASVMVTSIRGQCVSTEYEMRRCCVCVHMCMKWNDDYFTSKLEATAGAAAHNLEEEHS